VAEAAESVAAHVVLGAGDQHILDAIASHLPETLGPVTTIAGNRAADGLDAHLGVSRSAALDTITSAAIGAVGDLVASRAEGPDAAASYQIGSRPTEFLIDDPDTGVEVPLEDGLVWAALHQDAIVVQLPDRTGPLAGEPVAALLRRGSAG
jgi:hypothetical protein